MVERAAEAERRRVAEVEERRAEERLRLEREEDAERAAEARRVTERQLREAELRSGAVAEVAVAALAESETKLPSEPESYWWDAHQNHKLDDRMEVCGSGIGEPNRHVRVYFHTTFKEFMEEVS